MPKYLIQGSYSADGVKGLLKEGGTGRRTAIEGALNTIGGKLESIYYAFGDTDVFVIIEAPDNVSAAALALGVSSTGLVAAKTTVLLTLEEIDQAGQKNLNYRGPGA